MATLVTECLKEVEKVRRLFRGQADEIRPRYRQLTEAMLVRFTQLSPEDRLAFWNSLSREDSGLLLGIARSAATSSVEERNADRLRWGLLALLAENQRSGYRETLIELTLLDNSARKLRISLEDTFAPLKTYGTDETRALIESYFAEGDRRLAAMGYVEAKDKAGRFIYKQAW